MERARTIWFARHAERIDLVDPAWLKTAERSHDPCLTENGVIQARELGQRLRDEGIVHIFSSPFYRAIETAYKVAELLDIPVKIENGFSEFLSVDLFSEQPTLRPVSHMAKIFPRVDPTYISQINPEYPESAEELNKRTRKTMRLLLRKFSGDFLVVSHGQTLRDAIEELIQEKSKVLMTSCCLNKVVQEGEIWKWLLKADESFQSSPSGRNKHGVYI